MNPAFGVLVGLGAALFQSFSYVASRRFVNRYSGSTLYLLVMSHLFMGGFSVFLFPFARPESIPPWRMWVPAMVGSVFFYLSGQASLFLALRHSHPSRVSPLLGLKVLVLALVGSLFLNDRLSTLQWGAVAMSIGAAYLLSRSGKRLSWSSIGWIVSAVFCYSLSDINIRHLVISFEGMTLFRASLWGVTLCYLLSGVVALVLLPMLPRRKEITLWKASLPFAVAWYTAIIMLFACFASIGVVFGNLVQSSRGIISIVLGAAIAAAGHLHIEEKVSPGILASRIGAGLLMTGAIVLFALG